LRDIVEAIHSRNADATSWLLGNKQGISLRLLTLFWGHVTDKCRSFLLVFLKDLLAISGLDDLAVPPP
jgi:hypothetical protein